MIRTFILIAGIFSSILVGCPGAGNNKGHHHEPAGDNELSLPGNFEEMMAKGEKIYKAKCVVCHMPDGS